jgi:D-aminopeptidase
LYFDAVIQTQPVKQLIIFLLSLSLFFDTYAQSRPRELGIKIGVLPTGTLNAITDVAGVKVGQITLVEGADVRTGVTAIVPHEGNIFQQKVPAAIYIGNGFGKLAGYSQVEELGTMETPVILTNTLSVPTAADALIDWTLGQQGNEDIRSVNPVVGETNDGFLNDIRGRHVKKEHVLNALAQATGRYRHCLFQLERRHWNVFAETAGKAGRLHSRDSGTDQFWRSSESERRSGRRGIG